MASFLEFCSSCCTEYKVYRGHRQWLFFKHFLGSNRANLKAFVRRTGRLGKEKEAESYISDFFLQIINGCLTPSPFPPFPLRRSAVWLNYAVIKIVSFCRWEVPSLVSSVEPKIVATRSESWELLLCRFYQSEQGQQLFPSVIPHTKTFPPWGKTGRLTRIRNVSPGILISVFSPFFYPLSDAFVEIQLPRKMFCRGWIVNIFSMNTDVLDYTFYLVTETLYIPPHRPFCHTS